MEIEYYPHNEKTLEDFELIDRALLSDEKAYAFLMERYKKPLFHTILKMIRNEDDAQDLTLETFAKAFKNLPNFKKTHSFGNWLFKIGTNSAIDFIRKRKLTTLSINGLHNSSDGESFTLDVKDQGLDPYEKAIKEQKHEVIRVLVEQLPEKYQMLISLRYFKEYTYEEISVEMDIPMGTVKAQLFRAKELLLDIIQKQQVYF
jgi:RNA polymerase sigma-70 factor (ECF subfamily)